MKTHSRLTLSFLLLILIVPQVGSSPPRKDGPHVEYYKNGKKACEEHYNYGKLVSASVWKPDGTPCPLTKIVDGSGILVFWHENGQKKAEVHYKNGLQDALMILWHENGQKHWEAHYKDGIEISNKEF